MKHIITITRIESITTTEQGEWGVIDTVEEPRNQEYVRENEQMTRIKEVHGYRPERSVTKNQAVKIYEQTTEELNLPAVIKAINGI